MGLIMGKKVSKQVLLSFCALRDILTSEQCRKSCLCDRPNTFARFSEDDVFFVADAALGTCPFDVAWHAQRFR